MSRRETSITVHSPAGLTGAREWVTTMVSRGLEKGPVMVRLSRPTRSLDQNAAMWAMLADISAQVQWHGEKYSPEDWKDILTAALRKQRAVPGIEGGMVFLGQATSRMDREEMGELLDLIQHFGDSQVVEWTRNAETEGA
jgi:hypothetical protein